MYCNVYFIRAIVNATDQQFHGCIGIQSLASGEQTKKMHPKKKKKKREKVQQTMDYDTSVYV